MEINEALQQLVNALSLGAIYALFALGLAMVFSVLGLLNFAYGELITLAAYAMFITVRAGMPFWVVCLTAVATAALASLAMERIVFHPLRAASPLVRLFASFALAIVIQNILRQAVRSGRPQGVPMPSLFDQAFQIGSLRLGVLPVLTFGVGTAAVIGLTVWLQRTRAGLNMRAAAENFKAARLVGIRANRVVETAFVVSGILAGIAGILWVARRASVSVEMGFVPILKAFIATVIGGLGSLVGAAVGGFVLAFTEIAFQALLPRSIVAFTDAFSLIVVVAILYVRPFGLFGRHVEKIG